MNTEKKITLTAIILLILVIIFASFLGIYKLKNFKVKNVLPKYLLGMEFNNTRKVTMEVDNSSNTKILDSEGNEVEEQGNIEYTEENGYTTVEEKVNNDSILTKENYDQSKKIIVNKLRNLKVAQYVIRQNKNNGKMEIQIPENEDTDEIISVLNQNGKFEVVDENTNEVLLNKSHIASTEVNSNITLKDNSSLVVLVIKLNEQGKKIFSEMSTKYIKTTNKVVDEETGEEKDQESTLNVKVNVDDQTLLTYYFENNSKSGRINYLDASNGIIMIPFGNSAEQEKILELTEKAGLVKILIDSKEMPITYNIAEITISAEITNINTYIYIGIAIIAIFIIINIYKFKLKGLVLSFLQVGYVALLMLIIRYTNIVISLDGMIGLLVAVFVNFIFGLALFKNVQNINETFKNYLINLIPLYVIAVVFSFGVVVSVTGLGMILFWGLVSMYIYNILITKTVLKSIVK